MTGRLTKLGRVSRIGAAAFVCSVAVAHVSHAQSTHGRGWLGVAMANSVDATSGVRVEHVVHGSPAERAGLRTDDRILQVDTTTVGTSRDVVRVVGLHASGEAVSVRITRAGASQQLRVVLADFPSGDAILRMDHVGSPAPEWSGLEPLSGFPATVAATRGHVVIVDFWATWCGPCREVAPVLSALSGRYAAQGLTVVGITTDPAGPAAAFKEQLNLRYPMASDPHGTTSAAYGVSALPTLFVVDKRGIVRDVAVGTGPGEDARLESLIQTLLAEPSP